MTRHVAVDVRMARDSGIGTYIRQLLPLVMGARPQWRFSLLGRRAELDALGWSALANVTPVDCVSRIYTVAEQRELVRRTPSDVDLFWSPHYNIPVMHRGRLLVTVHDVLHLAMPQYVRNPVKRAYARLMFTAVQHRADAILTVSDFSRREYRRLAGRAGPEPVVVHNGVGEEWLEAGSAGLPRQSAHDPVTVAAPPEDRPYVVFVGNVKPHKNLGTLVRAFGMIAERIPHDLVIVGRREGLRGPDAGVEREAASLGDRVRFTGEASDAELRRYVAGASALVMPSLYEGFGLPPLEAMAIGCPTLVARAASLPEVCRDAAMYCDPLDANDMGRALQVLLTDEGTRSALRAAGRAHARGFRWARSAAATLTVIEQTMGGA